MSRYQRHFFIRQTKRPPFAPKPSCGGRGSDRHLLGGPVVEHRVYRWPPPDVEETT